MIKELIKLANDLDSKGLVKEADALDRIATQIFKKSAGRRLVRTIGDGYGNGVKVYKTDQDEYIVIPPDSDPRDSEAGYYTDNLQDAKGTAKLMWKDYMEEMPALQKKEMARRAFHAEATEVYSEPTRNGDGMRIKQPRDGESIEMVSKEVAQSLSTGPGMDEAILAWYSGNAREYLENKGSPVDDRPESGNDEVNLFNALVWMAVENEMFNQLEGRPTMDELESQDYEERFFGPPPSEEDFESDLPRLEL